MTAGRALGELPMLPQQLLRDGRGWPSDFGVSGVTLRQWYAGLAMQGIRVGSTGSRSAKVVAEEAVQQADALLDELAKVQS